LSKQAQHNRGEQCDRSNMVVLKNKSKSCSDNKAIAQLTVGGRCKKVFTPAQEKLKNRKKLSENEWYSINVAGISVDSDYTGDSTFKNDGFEEDVHRNRR